MKYIKDRFYNSRKRNPSLGAPAQDLFTREERTAFLAGCEYKGTTSFWNHQIFGEVFFESFIGARNLSEKLQSYWKKKPSKLPVVHLSRNRVRHFRPVGSPSSLGNLFLLSCECKGTTTFRIHQIFGEVFFSRASPMRLTPIIYRSAQIAVPIILQCHIR